MLYNENGKDSYLSFGGGSQLGVYAGRLFTNWLDVELAYLRKTSSTIPRVADANITFISNSFSLTPYLIIPIQKGYAQ